MKKTAIVFLVVFLLMIPTAAMGLNSPSVSEGHGVITGMFVTNTGLVLGAEFGLSSDLAIFGNYAFINQPKLGLKYELNPTLALTGGVIGFSPMSPFLGINAAAVLGKNLSALGEVDFTMAGNTFIFMYEAGLKYNLARQLDIRAGLLGSTAGSGVDFQLGIGYKF